MAISPFAILPINILSTMLYNRLTIWAIIAGTARFISNLPTLPSPKFTFLFFIKSSPNINM